MKDDPAWLLRALPAVAGVLTLLAGCGDPAIDRGRPPPILLSQEIVTVRLGSDPPDPAFATAIGSLGGARALNAVHARIETVDPTRLETVRAELLAMGIDPARITVWRQPQDRVVFTRMQDSVADCRSGIDPGPVGDVSQSFESIAECEQARVLATSVVDPADLVSPPQPGLADGAKAARAVLQWEGGQAKPASAPAGGGADGATGGGSGGGAGQSASGSVVSPDVAAGALSGGAGAAGGANPLASSAPLLADAPAASAE